MTFFLNFDGFFEFVSFWGKRKTLSFVKKTMIFFDTPGPGNPGGGSIVERKFFGSKQPLWHVSHLYLHKRHIKASTADS